MADVVIVEGWFPGPDRLRDPLWRGPLAEFMADNEMSEAGERTMLIFDLAECGWSQMAGGAAPQVTVYDAAAYDELAQTVTESEA